MSLSRDVYKRQGLEDAIDAKANIKCRSGWFDVDVSGFHRNRCRKEGWKTEIGILFSDEFCEGFEGAEGSPRLCIEGLGDQ